MSSTTIRLPRRLPLLIIDGVLFPGASVRIPVTSYRNMNMVKSHLLNRTTLASAIIGVVPKEVGTSSGDEDRVSMHPIGTAGIVLQVTGTNWPRPSYTLLVTGLCRFKLENLAQESPYLVGGVKQLDKFSLDSRHSDDSAELEELKKYFKDQATKLLDTLDLNVPAVVRLKRLMDSIPLHSLPDVCAAMIRATHAEKLEILDAVDLTERLHKTLPLLLRQIEGLRSLRHVKKDSSSKPSLQIEKFIPPITRQTSDFDDDDIDDLDDVVNLEQKIKSLELSEQARKLALKEIQRLKKMPTHMPEYAMTRTYLDLIIDLPWAKFSSEVVDIVKSRKDLDNDHFGLEKLKRRVLEYLAVRQLKNSLKGPILCFVGPPGVGKTSVGKSIARSLGREFHRISLGGVCDQADIRGHRRTYIGSMPGRIIQGLKTVAVKNPVFLLDEIDKLTAGVHGDPAAALLEVLDPEQNSSFTDHYLNLPFDLSQVLFIATANTTQTIPPALLDRMEIISIPGYTHDEKHHIAKNHLLPKQLNEHGLSEEQLILTDDAIKSLIVHYTKEGGVRNLERKIGAVCRAIAVKIVSTKQKEETSANHAQLETHKAVPSFILPIVIGEESLESILGAHYYDNEMCPQLGLPGVAIGMAWTAVGGEIIYVEATKMYGDGELTLTGKLGDVMKESARIALNWVRNHVHSYRLQAIDAADLMENTDIHIHFPAGAVSKDGPSAGVTIAVALVSLFTDRIVDPETAMTGELTLRGLILPVGGIKCKVLAAHRAGMKRVVLPKKNEKDLAEIPASIQAELTFHFVSTIDEALQVVFSSEFEEEAVEQQISLSSKL